MQKYALTFLAGMLVPLLGLVWLGGDTLTQMGLRLTAIEQGFQLAGRHWQFEAAPAHEVMVAIEEPKKGRTKR